MKEYHVLVSREMRHSVELRIAPPIPPMRYLHSKVLESLKVSVGNSMPVIMSMERLQIDSTICVDFLLLPHELLHKLVEAGCYRCKFYVSSTQNDPKQVSVLDGPPKDDDLSFYDSSGNIRAHETVWITL